MAIVQTIRDDLLSMCGLEDVSHGPTILSSRIIGDINRALEQVGESNPSVFYQTRPDQAEVMRGPVNVTVTVTNKSKAITFTSGYDSSWMPGCAISISGDGVLNRIQDEASPSAPALAEPYMGTTGTTTATVYQDWIMLPTDVRSVMEPVTVDKTIILIPSLSPQDQAVRLIDYNRNYNRQYSNYVMALKKIVGDPYRWWPYAQMVLGTLRAGIMVDSLPPSDRKLCFDAKKTVFAPVTSLSDTRTSLMPQGKDIEILLPVARWFFSSFQMCSITKESLQGDYQLAMQKAAELTVFANRMKRFTYTNQR